MGIRAASIVPDAILDALIDVIFAPPPIVTLPLNVPEDAIIDPTVIFGVPVNPADVPVVF